MQLCIRPSPQARTDAGVPEGAVKVTDAALAALVDDYARLVCVGAHCSHVLVRADTGSQQSWQAMLRWQPLWIIECGELLVAWERGSMAM